MVLRQGERVVIVVAGILAERAILLSELLSVELGYSVAVVSILQMKPWNESVWLQFLQKFSAVVCIEEHQEAGGVGSALAEFLSTHSPRPVERIGVPDKFGTSGPAEALLDSYGFGVESMGNRVRQFLKRHQVL